MGKLITLCAAALGLFSSGVMAQHNHSQADSDAPASGGKTMGVMHGQEEMSQLMDKMMASMSAINNEKDPDKLKTLLAEHTALMGQIRDKMSKDHGMKECPMMSPSTASQKDN